MTTPRLFTVSLGVLLFATACGLGQQGTFPPSSRDSLVREGDKAPKFVLRSADGKRISLSDFRGRKPVLLYFSMGPG